MYINWLSIIFLLPAFSGLSQSDTTVVLDDLVIAAERLAGSTDQSVRSTQSIQVQALTLSTVSINDHLEEVPNLFITNGYNYAQDPRISIRGFGARSAFGIRGVKVIVDGVPETTPDGQGQLDNINLMAIDRVDIIKGSASSLYGNASGGVVSINTLHSVENTYVEGTLSIGSFGLRRYDLGVGLDLGQSDLIIHANHSLYDGFRANSEFKSTNINARWLIQLDKHHLDLNLNVTDSPIANDPGGVNLESAIADRSQARDRNVSFLAGESITHNKASLRHRFRIADNQTWNNYIFYSNRDFLGRLPFEDGGIIDLGRTYYGLGSNYRYDHVLDRGVNQLLGGIDIANQSDDRDRYINDMGQQGELVFSQVEGFNNIGLFLMNKLILDRSVFEIGVRYDINDLSVEDNNLSNGDNSDDISLNSLSYNTGLSYSLTDALRLSVGASSSFETPTLSELSADPDGSEGFNTNLQPMTAHTLDIGLAYQGGNSLTMDLDLFYTKTDNEIISFEIDQFPNRDFFRNAGSTSRYGIELVTEYDLSNQLNVNATYSYLKATFDEYIIGSNDLEGNTISGIPSNRFTLSVSYLSDNGLSLRAQFLSTGTIFANDSNSTSIDPYNVVNIHGSYDISSAQLKIKPFINISNLFNTEYFSNIRINAFGSRFYEPAPPTQIMGGVKVRF